MSNNKWEKKYASVPKGLIEELAELRHNQMRSWSKSVIDLAFSCSNLEEFQDKMSKLCGNNWKDYNKLEDVYKGQSRVFAFAVYDIIRKYSGAQSQINQ